MKARRKRRLKIWGVVGLCLVFAILAWPREDLILSKIGIDKPLEVKKGLDLEGGVRLVYEAQLDQVEGEGANQDEILKNVATVIERRINPGGASEAIVQSASGGRVIVEIPAVSDPKQAIATIGRTAKLEFFEVREEKDKQRLVPTKISGADIQRATADFEAQTGQPIVSLQLKGGRPSEEFGELTSKLAASGEQLVTLLDKQVVFGPANVQNAITDGRAQLSGGFSARDAKEIATLLNAGALPVPVDLVAQQTIGPTLGAQSVKASLVAATIGLLSVAIFLLTYYRWLGLAAVGALVFYSLALLSIIKLSTFTPYVIVLTLAGVAGFILSIAVAVDANILIMERIKEELQEEGSPLGAISRGFDHAWTSIRDANVTTIIGAVILYKYGAQQLVKGFALTLGLGVAINLLTILSVSRVLMNTLARSSLSERAKWAGIKVEKKL